MYSLLLRKALPFALTFILGSLVGGLFKGVGFGGLRAERTRAFRYSYGGRHSCRMRFQRRDLVAEFKPLTILFKPDAILPAGWAAPTKVPDSVTVNVTFGADGKVQYVAPDTIGCSTPMKYRDAAEAARKNNPVWDAVERAAWQIKFEPEVENGVPLTVNRPVEIRVTLN
jgi:hypothetical protein